MQIIVCVKQTPKSEEVRINPETGCLVRTGTAGELNPCDLHALEAAALLKEQTGARVCALTMGPLSAEEILRESIARGADEVFLLSDASFAGADTYATAYTLAKGIEKIAPADDALVICGLYSADGDTGSVGAQIAAWLGLPYACAVQKIVRGEDRSLTIQCATDGGSETVTLPRPCVISVLKEIAAPRVRSVQGRMRAKKASVTVWNAQDIGADNTKTGLAGSPTRVLKTFAPQTAAHADGIAGENAREKARNLIACLKEKNLI